MSNLAFKLRSGGKAIGPSHNEGGIVTKDQDGAPVAEIEGDERVFSVEHTEELETKADEISNALAEEEHDLANELATALGFRVVEMIAEQEKINPTS